MRARCRNAYRVLATDALAANLLGLGVGIATIVGLIPAATATLRIFN